MPESYLIVEDEESIARRLKRMLGELTPSPETGISICPNLSSAKAFLEENDIDLLFLDLNLEGSDGFTLLQELTSHSFQVIIASAYTERAIEAFSYGVLDFLPKPFSRERLAQALDRYNGQARLPEAKTQFLSIREAGSIRPIPVSAISHIAGAGDYSEIHLLPDKSDSPSPLLHDKNLEQLLHSLEPDFVRIHKSYLVPLAAIQSLHSAEGSRYSLTLKEGTQLPVGRTRFKALRALLDT